MDGAGVDRVLATAHAWHAARSTTRALCRKQQQLETQLAAEVGFPPASVRLPDGTLHLIASLQNLREALGQGPFDTATQTAVDHWERWHDRDIAVGYSAVKAAEHRAANDQQQLLDDLAGTEATSVAGIVAKLEVLALAAEDNNGSLEAAVPHIRSVLTDLERTAGAEPASAAAVEKPTTEQNAPASKRSS
jgi:hypothetical protein